MGKEKAQPKGSYAVNHVFISVARLSVYGLEPRTAIASSSVVRLSRGIKGGADGAELDVGEEDGRVGVLVNNLVWVTGVSGAATTLRAGAGSINGEGGVEPEHVGVVLETSRLAYGFLKGIAV